MIVLNVKHKNITLLEEYIRANLGDMGLMNFQVQHEKHTKKIHNIKKY